MKIIKKVIGSNVYYDKEMSDVDIENSNGFNYRDLFTMVSIRSLNKDRYERATNKVMSDGEIIVNKIDEL